MLADPRRHPHVDVVAGEDAAMRDLVGLVWIAGEVLAPRVVVDARAQLERVLTVGEHGEVRDAPPAFGARRPAVDDSGPGIAGFGWWWV